MSRDIPHHGNVNPLSGNRQGRSLEDPLNSAAFHTSPHVYPAMGRPVAVSGNSQDSRLRSVSGGAKPAVSPTARAESGVVGESRRMLPQTPVCGFADSGFSGNMAPPVIEPVVCNQPEVLQPWGGQTNIRVGVYLTPEQLAELRGPARSVEDRNRNDPIVLAQAMGGVGPMDRATPEQGRSAGTRPKTKPSMSVIVAKPQGLAATRVGSECNPRSRVRDEESIHIPHMEEDEWDAYLRSLANRPRVSMRKLASVEARDQSAALNRWVSSLPEPTTQATAEENEAEDPHAGINRDGGSTLLDSLLGQLRRTSVADKQPEKARTEREVDKHKSEAIATLLNRMLESEEEPPAPVHNPLPDSGPEDLRDTPKRERRSSGESIFAIGKTSLAKRWISYLLNIQAQ